MRALKDFGALVAVMIALAAGLVGYGALTQKAEATSIRVDKIEPVMLDVAALKEAIQDIRETVHRLEK